MGECLISCVHIDASINFGQVVFKSNWGKQRGDALFVR